MTLTLGTAGRLKRIHVAAVPLGTLMQIEGNDISTDLSDSTGRKGISSVFAKNV